VQIKKCPKILRELALKRWQDAELYGDFKYLISPRSADCTPRNLGFAWGNMLGVQSTDLGLTDLGLN
jgi:hypothetical protein